MTAKEIADELDEKLKACPPLNQGGYGQTEQQEEAELALAFFLRKNAEAIRDALRTIS